MYTKKSHPCHERDVQLSVYTRNHYSKRLDTRFVYTEECNTVQIYEDICVNHQCLPAIEDRRDDEEVLAERTNFSKI